MREFYCNILSTDYSGDDVHSEINTEGLSITLFSLEGMEDMAPGSMENAGSGNFTISISVDNIEDLYKKIISKNIELVKELQFHP